MDHFESLRLCAFLGKLPHELDVLEDETYHKWRIIMDKMHDHAWHKIAQASKEVASKPGGVDYMTMVTLQQYLRVYAML